MQTAYLTISSFKYLNKGSIFDTNFFPSLRNSLTTNTVVKAKIFLMKVFIAFSHQKDQNMFSMKCVFARKDVVLHQVHPLLHEILQGILPWVCRNQGKVDEKGFWYWKSSPQE